MSIGCFSQSLNYDLCRQYINHYEEEKLKLYLDEFESNMSHADDLSFFYFRSLQHRYLNAPKKQLESLYKGLSLERNSEPDSIYAFILDELSIVLQKNFSEKDSEEAIELINKSIEIKENFSNTTQLGKSYLIKGNAFFRRMGTNTYANLDSARSCYQKAITFLGDNNQKYFAIESLANVYRKKGQYKESLALYKQSLNNYKVKGDQDDITITSAALSNLYIKMKKYDQAKEILDTLIIDEGDHSLVTCVLEYRAELADSLQDYKSASFWKDSILRFQHDIFDSQKIEAAEKYKSLSLETQLAKEQSITLKNKYWMTLLGSVSLILGLLSFSMYRFYKLKKQASDQELLNVKIKSALDSTRAKMDGEQNERQAIASVLHDHMASSLAAARINLSVAKKKSDHILYIEKAEKILTEVNDQVRNLSHQLVSPSLIKFGLATAIESLADNMSIDNLVINFNSNIGKQRFENAKEVFLYRSCAEFLQNVHKHSDATEANINLKLEEDKVILIVEDNGSKRKSHQKLDLGLGLISIKDRAEAFGGDFTFLHTTNGFSNRIEILSKEIN